MSEQNQYPQSKQILLQIKDHYSSGSPNYVDLIQYLKSDHIDNNSPTKFQHGGFDVDNEGSFAMFYYSDKSSLLVNYGLQIFQEID